MKEGQEEGLFDQLKSLVRDVFDHLNKTLELQQARFTSFALSSILFTLQILVAFFLAAAAFVLFNVAIGMGLTLLFGNALWAVVSLAVFYLVAAFLLSHKALKWLKKLQS